MRSSSTFGVRNVRVKEFRMMRRHAEAGRLKIWPSIFLDRRLKGHEQDSFPVQLVQVLVGGQLRVKHKLPGERAGVLVPESNKAEDLSGLLCFGDPRIRIAENPCLRIPGEEDKNALLTPAPAGDVVLFERFFLGIGRNRVKVEIDRRAPFEACTLPVSYT